MEIANLLNVQLSKLLTLATAAEATTTKWDLTSFLENANTQITNWGGAFLIIMGTIGIIFSAYQIISTLMSQGKKQANYASNIILLIISGALATTGITLVFEIAGGGAKTINDLGTAGGTIMSSFDFDTAKLLLQNGLLF